MGEIIARIQNCFVLEFKVPSSGPLHLHQYIIKPVQLGVFSESKCQSMKHIYHYIPEDKTEQVSEPCTSEHFYLPLLIAHLPLISMTTEIVIACTTFTRGAGADRWHSVFILLVQRAQE